MTESKSIHAAEDWGVVLQSVPSKNKKEVVKRLEEIFGIDKRDAEQVLANMPLILVDNISFGLAARIKKFFQTIGAVAETTNHDMIKKNCFQVVWPQTPDLSFFMKNETGPAEAPAPEKKGNVKPAEAPPVEKKTANYEMKPEAPKSYEAPLSTKPIPEAPSLAPHYPPPPVKPAQEAPSLVPHYTPPPAKPVQEAPSLAPHYAPPPAKPVQEAPSIVPHPHPASEEKPAAASSSSADSDWERRAKELNEKLRKIHDEKQALHVQHTEATEKVKQELHAQHTEVTEKVKSEFQQQLEAEKKKGEEIAKAYEDLRTQAQKHEALTREGEEWRVRAVALGEKVRELETNLMQKSSSLDHLVQQKDDLIRQSEKAVAETQHELSTLRGREQEFFRKIEELERNVQYMADSLRARDGALAQFEKQIVELAEKAQGYEAMRQEHAQLSNERATIRQEYDGKLVEQEVRLAKVEEEHRRYRSRIDRKSAAATRELGEWIRGVDTIRQGLQKLILFLGSDSAVLDSERKSNLRSPLTRGPDAPNIEKN